MAGAPEDAEVVRIRERQRLAIELHASVAQSLFAIAVEADVGLGAAEPDARERALRAIRALTATARQELYDTLARLNRAPEGVAFHARADDAVHSFSQASGIAARLALAGTVRPLGALCEELVLDTLDEALRNVRKHTAPDAAAAREVAVELVYGSDAVCLRVTNSGVASVRPDHDRPDGRGCLGLLGERAAQLRGRLDLQMRQGGGAVLLLELPTADRARRGLATTPIAKGSG
jgi:signal transduction histidine kinase